MLISKNELFMGWMRGRSGNDVRCIISTMFTQSGFLFEYREVDDHENMHGCSFRVLVLFMIIPSKTATMSAQEYCMLHNTLLLRMKIGWLAQHGRFVGQTNLNIDSKYFLAILSLQKHFAGQTNKLSWTMKQLI